MKTFLLIILTTMLAGCSAPRGHETAALGGSISNAQKSTAATGDRIRGAQRTTQQINDELNELLRESALVWVNL